MSKKANPPPPVPSRGAVALLALGVAESALALFQWSQLLTLRGGGATVCGVSERINCETVWNTPFASRVHELLGIPVAGLGLLWGLVATALAGLYLVWRRGGHTVRPAVNGLRITAAAGVLATVVFATVSAGAGALCPTCLGTYALVLAFAGVAWRGLPGAAMPLAGEWGGALKWTGGFAMAGFVALLAPGRATPKASAEKPLPQVTAEPGSIEAYLKGLSPREQQFASNALDQYRRDTPLPARAPARRRYGPVDAPVKIVEWTDSKCPHCKMLVESIAALKQRVPEGKMSLEARQYPLDGACNPSIPPEHSDGTGTRCVAAKAQICLEQAPDYWALREKLFASQSSLNPELVMELASSGSVSRAQLEACVNSPETTRRIQEDVAYAKQHDIHGTPLVVVNGREVPPSVPFLYALVMAGGDTSAPAFRVLPPPQPPVAHSH
ncbi:MAG: thioredoxin domain-containing protein [Myxococcaceae bacterium]|nr:thioredoxin domain-containing protein [Myxococcaceae bacterium]